jgi:hypothetical protein
MLNARKSESGPRVATLQILLNRYSGSGTVLKVDGIFGQQTARAVSEYKSSVMRQSAGETADQADPTVFSHLMRQAQVQGVDAVDITDVGYLRTVVPWLARQAEPITIAGMCNGLAQAIGDVVSRGSGRDLLFVRFHGHGSPGLQSISHGTRKLAGTMDYNQERTVLNAHTLRALSGAIAQLGRAMCPFGFVELHGCRVAKGSKGQDLLKSLAQLWRVPVTAGVPYAKTGYDPVARQAVSYDLEAPIITAYPESGGLAAWARARALRDATAHAVSRPRP